MPGDRHLTQGIGLDGKRRTFLLGTLSCTVLARREAPAARLVLPRSNTPEPTPPACSVPATAGVPSSTEPDPTPRRSAASDLPSRKTLIRRYSGKRPTAWGDAVPRVVLWLPTSDRVVALTWTLVAAKRAADMTRDRTPEPLQHHSSWST
jgi:hypothetical protein